MSSSNSRCCSLERGGGDGLLIFEATVRREVIPVKTQDLLGPIGSLVAMLRMDAIIVYDSEELRSKF